MPTHAIGQSYNWPVVLHHFRRLGCLVGATGDGKEKPPEGTKPTTYAEKRS